MLLGNILLFPYVANFLGRRNMVEQKENKKVKLRCGVYGEGTVFSVEIEHDAEVEALQEAIVNKKKDVNDRFNVHPALVTLYLARKNGAWLNDDDSLDDLLSREKIDLTYRKMRSSWQLADTEYFRDFQPGAEEIHILVELPKREYANSQYHELYETLLHHVLVEAPTSTYAQSHHFKANLCATYGCSMQSGMLRCMLLDTALPAALVVASHLFRQKNEFIAEQLMRISDIDDVRNGLLLFKPLEHALDHFQISFIYDQSSNEFRLKIFDHSVRPQRLFGKLDNKQRASLLRGQALPKNWRSRGPRLAPGTVYDIQTIFGDLEGRALRFKSVERPYKRCLNLQARLARMQAIEKDWIRLDENNFQDFWSEGMSLAEKMEFFYANEELTIAMHAVLYLFTCMTFAVLLPYPCGRSVSFMPHRPPFLRT
nr:crinkler 23 [Plasmopara viticola]